MQRAADDRPFRLCGSLDGRSPLLLASPHSGRRLPADFLAASRLPVPTLRRLEDAHVGLLLHGCGLAGVPLIEATHARAVIDLNRAETDHDPAMIEGKLTPAPVPSDRVRQGYGLFPRIAGGGLAIHQRRIPAAVAQARIAALHRPWHQAIADALQSAQRRHGFAVLLDMHSMPPVAGALPPHVVLGDRHGCSAAVSLVDWLEQAFRQRGFRVARNAPYAGGHTTEHHAAPAEGRHVVQIEFARDLYMDARTLAPHQGFAPLARSITAVISELLAAMPAMNLGATQALAAE